MCDAANLGRAVYDRCTVVALCSAKAQNPGCTVALVTNAPPPEPFASQLQAAGVEIWACPFDAYRVPADTNWALAYYKLCAMDWVLAHREFANAAMIDLDTYTSTRSTTFGAKCRRPCCCTRCRMRRGRAWRRRSPACMIRSAPAARPMC